MKWLGNQSHRLCLPKLQGIVIPLLLSQFCVEQCSWSHIIELHASQHVSTTAGEVSSTPRCIPTSTLLYFKKSATGRLGIFRHSQNIHILFSLPFDTTTTIKIPNKPGSFPLFAARFPVGPTCICPPKSVRRG